MFFLISTLNAHFLRATLLGLAFSLLIFSNTKAQSYSTNFDTPAEQNEWTEFRLGAIHPIYFWDFDQVSSISSPSSLVHYYPVGGNNFTNDWFVSPAIDLSNGGTIDTLWTYYSGFGTPLPTDTVALYVLNGSNDPALATSQTMVILFTDTTYQPNSTWESKTGIALPTLSGSSYLAFRYVTDANWLDVRFDNLRVSTLSTGVGALNSTSSTLQVFPNPASGQVSIDLPEQTKVKDMTLFDVLGNRVLTFASDTKHLDLSPLENGAYFLRVSTADGTLTQTVIKQ